MEPYPPCGISQVALELSDGNGCVERTLIGCLTESLDFVPQVFHGRVGVLDGDGDRAAVSDDRLSLGTRFASM
jgi:hypothetical protein